MAAWNALLVISGMLLIGLVGEGYLRLANPFIGSSIPAQFVDGVGLIREPNAELRYGDLLDDNYVISHTNSLGFLDREPISPDRAAESCHIAFIGDSLVEAWEAPISDKFHVRLEEMAARQLPHLDITTQAYGIRGTGQINQLPFYDEYARRLKPKLVVPVFYFNDFAENSTVLQSLRLGANPDRLPYMSAQRDESGAMKLRPPDPEYDRFLLPQLPKAWHERARDRLIGISYFAAWLNTKRTLNWGASGESQVAAWAAMIAERPCCAPLLGGSVSDYRRLALGAPFREEHLQPFLEDALAYTAFGIEQFKRRATRDGAALAILSATQDMGTRGDPQFDRLYAIAEPLEIPLISDYDYNISRGRDPEVGRWRNDKHWNPVGHRWVAEAILEWLKANQDVCD